MCHNDSNPSWLFYLMYKLLTKSQTEKVLGSLEIRNFFFSKIRAVRICKESHQDAQNDKKKEREKKRTLL